jgi:NAD(P)-dependent dehydrogenase (short-subunit alcohol dehydrogenase family)
LGLETARVLAINGANVVICSRSIKNGMDAIATLKKDHPNVNITTMQLDLGSFKSIYAFVAAYKATNKPLNLLINNAGIMACPKTLTEDGFESQFGVNHLGHFLLTTQLLPLLSAAGTRESPSRVINLSSAMHWLASSLKGMKFDDLDAKLSYNPYARYGQSKLANILFTRELNRRMKEQNQNVISVAVHPGIILSTGLNKHTDFATICSMVTSIWGRRGSFGYVGGDKGKSIPEGEEKQLELILFVLNISYLDLSTGSSTTVYTALSPDIIPGEYYSDCAVQDKFIHEQCADQTAWKRLWEISEQMVQSKN